MSLSYCQTNGAFFFPPGKVSIFISQNTKALDGWTSLATIGNILEEDTIPNEVLSSQEAFYWWRETFVGLLLFERFFYILIFTGMIVAFPPAISPQVCVFTR